MRFNFPKVHVKTDNARADVSLDRFEGNFSKAQFLLDSMVMTDMEPYMPMITHTFINLTKARSAAIAGTGYVYAAAPPYGRFLYEGKVMVSPSTGSTYAKYGEEKVLVSEYQGKTRAKEDIEYTKTFHPNVQAHWFDVAKKKNRSKWVRLTKEMAGDGR